MIAKIILMVDMLQMALCKICFVERQSVYKGSGVKVTNIILVNIKTHRLRFFWNLDAAENNCLMVVFFFGFLRCMAADSMGNSDASSGRASRTAVNRSSKIRCLPTNRGSLFSISRQPAHKHN